jgi:plastocyanin
VTIAGSRFSPAHLDARAGQVAVSVRNDDDVRHTFTVTGTSIDIAVDPHASGSASTTLAAGDYQFHCRIHSFMTGTLTVS